MPYSNIVFVKLFVKLLDEDDRFLYQLNESQQLLYLKMLILAGKTGNDIPKTYSYIKNTINYNHEETCFEADIQRIMVIYPKLKVSEKSYYFEKFEELHNYIKDFKGKPKENQRNSKGWNRSRSRSRSRDRIRNKKKEKGVDLPPKSKSASSPLDSKDFIGKEKQLAKNAMDLVKSCIKEVPR